MTPDDILRREHIEAFRLFASLPSGFFFSWTDKSAGFHDPAEAETFKRDYPDWKV
jgi:hypothetical protein